MKEFCITISFSKPTHFTLKLPINFLNLEDHGFSLGASIGVDLYEIDATVIDVIGTVRDSIKETVPIPIGGLHLELPISDFLITADISGLVVTIENIDVSYLDISAMVLWEPVPGFGIFAGYRLIDAEIENSDFTLDTRLEGPFFGGQIRF